MSKVISRLLVMKKIIGLLVLAVWTGTASASLIELGPETSGEIKTLLFPSVTAGHYRPLTSISGPRTSMAHYQVDQSYLIFDLSSIAFTAQSATLVLDVGFGGRINGVPGDLSLWGLDTYTPDDLVALPTGTLDTEISLAVAIGLDLRSGTSLATVFDPVGVVGIELNATALGQINAANGLWGFGLINFQGYSPIDVLSPPRLVLSGEPISPPSPAPVPATLALLSLGLVGIGISRRKLKTHS
jgi:hypothetical protein